MKVRFHLLALALAMGPAYGFAQTSPAPQSTPQTFPSQQPSSNAPTQKSGDEDRPRSADQDQANPQSSQTPSTQAPTTAQPSGASASAVSNIQSALQKDSSLASQNISVSSKDNSIVLSGTVATQDDKARAEQIAQSMAGSSMTVVNQITVSGKPSSTTTPPSTVPKGDSSTVPK